MQIKPHPEAVANAIDTGKDIFLAVALDVEGSSIKRAKTAGETSLIFFSAAGLRLIGTQAGAERR